MNALTLFNVSFIPLSHLVHGDHDRSSLSLLLNHILSIQLFTKQNIFLAATLLLAFAVIFLWLTYQRRVARLAKKIKTCERDKLHENQHRLHILAQTVPGILYSVDVSQSETGTLTYLNDKIIDLCGYPVDDFLSGEVKWLNLVLEEDRDQVYKSIKATQESPFFSIEYRIKHKNGQIRWILNQGLTVFQHNQATSRHGIILDITDAKKSALALADREKELSKLVSALDDILLEIDERGYVKKIHAQQWPFAILPPNDILNKHITEALAKTPELAKTFTNLYEEAVTARTTAECEFSLVMNNATQWVRARVKPMAEPGTATVLLSNITSKKIAQEKLKQSEDRLQFILSKGDHILYTCNLKCETTYISSSVKNALGYDPEVFLANPTQWKSLIHPEDLSQTEEQSALLVQGKRLSYEYRIKHADGTWRWLRDQLILTTDLAGKPLEVIGTCIDITDRKEAEINLLQLNKELEELKYAINAASIVSITDTKGIIKYANKNFESVSQYSLAELLGKKHNVINSGYHSQKFWKDMWRTIMNGEVWREEVRNRAKDGSFYWVDTAIIPIKNVSGKIAEFISIRNEITEKKKNDEQLALLSLVAQHTSNYVIITDAEGNIEWVNESFEKFTGYQLADIKEKKPGTFLQGEETHPDTIRYMNKMIREEKPFTCELINYTSNGEKYWVEINAQPLKDKTGKVIRYFAIMHNITEQKWLVENLIQARQGAEESDRLKSAFIANMSHEIRTPMNAIMGFSELLSRSTLSIEKRNEFAHLIRQRSQDLLSIVNDILDVSKIESGQMPYVPVVGNIQELFEQLRSNFSAEANHLQNKSVEIIVHNELNDADNIVLADFIRLHQVLNNLITNALKFTQQGFVEFGCRLQDSNTLLFTVRDTGIGIEPDNIEKIFKPFQQADTTIHQHYGGTGLGLAIIKGLLKLWGGKIWVESEVGRGSVFYFTMPYHPQETSSLIEIPVQEDINWKNVIVLIVEDDIHSANYLKEILADTQCTIIHAESGQKAIEVASQTSPSLVLLDLALPDMPGKKVITHLLKYYPHLSIVPISEFAITEHKTMAMQLGCPAFLTKPISQKKLLQTLLPIISSIKEPEIQRNI